MHHRQISPSEFRIYVEIVFAEQKDLFIIIIVDTFFSQNIFLSAHVKIHSVLLIFGSLFY